MKNVLIAACLFLLSTSLQAQETKTETDKKKDKDELQIKLKDAPKPDIYIDGKKYDYAIFELLDQSKIASVNVVKDEQALKEYNAPNGVILITTKKTSQKVEDIDGIELRGKDNGKDPLIIIDGKVSSKDKLSQLSPENIESINVLKGETAAALYNAPNGAILVKTKK